MYDGVVPKRSAISSPVSLSKYRFRITSDCVASKLLALDYYATAIITGA